MGIVELLLIAVGLSMDAFAVAIGKGLSMKRLKLGHAAIIALFFGGFQALMPTLGWLVGAQFEQFVSAVSGWIAFALLAFIGAKMIWDAFHEDDEEQEEFSLNLRELLLLAVATSIDAFAAGVAFAMLSVNIAFTVTVIGITTFVLSFAGVMIGHQFGSRWERPSTIAGGCVLLIIGAKVLFESLGIL